MGFDRSPLDPSLLLSPLTPALDTLAPVRLTLLSRTWLVVLRFYLILAGGLVILRMVMLAAGG